MSNTNTRNLILSQPKSGQSEVVQTVTLSHTTILSETSTEVAVEVPGVNPSTVEVGFENGLLVVHCSKGELTLPINPTIDVSKIKADIKWGVLALSIPLPETPEARTIKVSIHDAASAKKPEAKPAPKTAEKPREESKEETSES
jgi:HSP20 family molecular chaperone IbpA